jgi:hypothetical protein
VIGVRVFVDVATNHVIWFSDAEEDFFPVKTVAQVDYKDPLPEAMTLKNCWNWVLRDRVLVPAKPKNNQSLYQATRAQTELLIRQKINEKRKSITSNMLFEESIEVKKITSASEYLEHRTASYMLSHLATLWQVDLKAAAERILEEWTAKERMLVQTEVQLQELLDRLNKARSTAECLQLHAQVMGL